MPFHRAVVWVDHHNAQVLQFSVDDVKAEAVHSHDHYTRQHGSAVRTEHEFFRDVCDKLSGVREVLVTGSHTAQAAFRHYVEQHRPALMKQIAGWEIADHPTQGQLLALARKFFVAHDRMMGL